VFPAFVAARAGGGDGSPWATLLVVAVWAVALRLVLLGAALLLARIASDDPARRRAVVFTASEKTLALGLPLAVLLFEGDPRLALVTLPLIVFHPLQLLIDAGLASRWAGQRI